MLTIIRNASAAKKVTAEVKNSRISEEIIKILNDEEFISNYKLIKDSKQGILRIYLRYGRDSSPALLGGRRISKPGLRIYRKWTELPMVYGGLGIAILSTPKGLMTDKEAREKKVGGEVICYAW